jgi:hypothetical protein
VSEIVVVMDVRVRLTWRIAWLVHVVMMLVVPVNVFVSHCFMVVPVSMALRDCHKISVSIFLQN